MRGFGFVLFILILGTLGCDTLPGDDPADMAVDAMHIGPLSPTPACPVGEAMTLDAAASDVRRLGMCLGVAVDAVDCRVHSIWLAIREFHQTHETVGFELITCEATTAPDEGPASLSTIRYRGADHTIPATPYGQGTAALYDGRPDGCVATLLPCAYDVDQARDRAAAWAECGGAQFADHTAHCWGPITRVDRRLAEGTRIFRCRLDLHQPQASVELYLYQFPEECSASNATAR